MREIWRQYRDTQYWVSNLGGIEARIKRALLPRKNGKGYQITMLCYPDGSQKTHFVHRLVAEVFKGPIQPGLVVNHIDGDPVNNSIRNLEYVTQSQNIKHFFRLRKPNRTGIKRRLLSLAEVVKIREAIRRGASCLSLSRKFGCSPSAIIQIKNKKTWISKYHKYARGGVRGYCVGLTANEGRKKLRRILLCK